MRGKKARYTFVIEFLGGTYVHQACGESPDLALRRWLSTASDDDFEWSSYRVDLLCALKDEFAVAVEGCQNVWCISGLAGDHLFLIHIIGTEPGAVTTKSVAEFEQIGTDPKLWGWGDRW